MIARRYIVITPARNEQDNIPHTIASMRAQKLRPVRWIIVNDGSTDRTAEIINQAATENDWITAVHRPDRGFRKQGGGVIDTFYDGLNVVTENRWDFLVKFDADLSFEADFFLQCLNEFSIDPHLGIAGGMICHAKDGRLSCESPGDPSFHVRGATKIYRRECWEDIGGLIRAPGWDTIDEFKANMLGWKTRTLPKIKLRHHRYTGNADGHWRNAVKNGLANYITGYHPLFMALKCISRLTKKPILINALGLAYGYTKASINGVPKLSDPNLLKYIRDQQIRKLTGKSSLWSVKIGDQIGTVNYPH